MVEYASCPREDSGIEQTESKNFFKEISKKVLTREKRCDIIAKLPARAGSEWSLKIEQQKREVQSINKQSECEVKISSKELYILNKVKEARKE